MDVTNADTDEVKLPASLHRHTFEYSDTDFQRLQKLVAHHTGISLADSKRDLVYGRLSRRLRSLGFERFDQYIALLNDDPGAELEHFTNAITTNLTSFFREKHHFEYLAKNIVPALLQRYRTTGRIRIWSAGCSTGEEPYSLAMTLRETIPDIDKLDLRILASDLDSDVVRTAASGIYPLSSIKGLDQQRCRRWFRRGTGPHEGMARVIPEIQNMIAFRQLNLMQEWPMQGPFDVIFCRNVVIYFDKETQSRLFERFAAIVQPDGHLVVGHSETLNSCCDRFKLIDKTIYRRTH